MTQVIESSQSNRFIEFGWAAYGGVAAAAFTGAGLLYFDGPNQAALAVMADKTNEQLISGMLTESKNPGRYHDTVIDPSSFNQIIRQDKEQIAFIGSNADYGISPNVALISAASAGIVGAIAVLAIHRLMHRANRRHRRRFKKTSLK